MLTGEFEGEATADAIRIMGISAARSRKQDVRKGAIAERAMDALEDYGNLFIKHIACIDTAVADVAQVRALSIEQNAVALGSAAIEIEFELLVHRLGF